MNYIEIKKPVRTGSTGQVRAFATVVIIGYNAPSSQQECIMIEKIICFIRGHRFMITAVPPWPIDYKIEYTCTRCGYVHKKGGGGHE